MRLSMLRSQINFECELFALFDAISLFVLIQALCAAISLQIVHFYNHFHLN